jgi:hypothetical protein
MPAIEIWGNATWTFFHAIIAHIDENKYLEIRDELFRQIQNICRVLPCPECSTDATTYLQRVNLSSLKTKNDMITLFYLFHNYVNLKKRKPLYDIKNISSYETLNMTQTFNQFVNSYNTNGNMKMMAEAFQRKLVIKDLVNWLRDHRDCFL